MDISKKLFPPKSPFEDIFAIQYIFGDDIIPKTLNSIEKWKVAYNVNEFRNGQWRLERKYFCFNFGRRNTGSLLETVFQIHEYNSLQRHFVSLCSLRGRVYCKLVLRRRSQLEPSWHRRPVEWPTSRGWRDYIWLSLAALSCLFENNELSQQLSWNPVPQKSNITLGTSQKLETYVKTL